MKGIVYFAVSLDGFIAGPGGDVSGFIHAGDGVEQYQKDLAEFQPVLLGRKT